MWCDRIRNYGTSQLKMCITPRKHIHVLYMIYQIKNIVYHICMYKIYIHIYMYPYVISCNLWQWSNSRLLSQVTSIGFPVEGSIVFIEGGCIGRGNITWVPSMSFRFISVDWSLTLSTGNHGTLTMVPNQPFEDVFPIKNGDFPFPC